MPTFRNDTGGVLDSHELRRSIGPGEEFDSDLPVPGCTPVDKPARRKAASGEQDKEPSE